MKSIKNIVKTPKKNTCPVPKKEILWAREPWESNPKNNDSNLFPDMASIIARNSSKHPSPLVTFGRAVAKAYERVWIIDSYFLDPEENKGTRQHRIGLILNWLPEDIIANDIRILTRSYNTINNKYIDSDLRAQFKEHQNIINELRSKGSDRFTIKIRFTLKRNFDYIHDRFAIIDNELWHFGATVGGFYSQVNAATRGWRADEHNAEKFFKLAWTAPSIKGKNK